MPFDTVRIYSILEVISWSVSGSDHPLIPALSVGLAVIFLDLLQNRFSAERPSSSKREARLDQAP